MNLKFDFTPDEALSVAETVAQFYKNKGMRVYAEKSAWPDAPARTTLLVEKSTLKILIEAQGDLSFTNQLKTLALWLASQRQYVEFYIATNTEANATVKDLKDMKKHGVGHLVVDEHGTVVIQQPARNPALVVTPDPTLTYGRCKKEVRDAIEKFNDCKRKDGLRDMCELVERETEKLALIASRSGYLDRAEQDIKDASWENQINMLESRNAYKPGNEPFVDGKLKDDLKSFKGARHLLDHKARNKREEKRRERQFVERMMMGPRLVSELLSLQRRVR